MEQQVIIYGGAFNPPTNAHKRVLEVLISISQKAERQCEVWLLPSGERDDKTIAVSEVQRRGYLDALIESVGGIGLVQVCDVELIATEHTHTAQTVRWLEKNYPEKIFQWAFGSDSVNTMSTWEEGDWLLEHLDMIVFQRPGYPLEVFGNNSKLLEATQEQMSSTEVRLLMEQGQDVSHFVPAPVSQIIEQR